MDLFRAYLFFFVNAVFADISDATGKDFFDDFEKYDEKLWEIEDNILQCHERCVFMKESNVKYKHNPNSTMQSEEYGIHIHMKRNCVGLHCCTEAGTAEVDCTRFTSGHIHSKHEYGYGTFFFLAKSAGIDNDSIPAWSCWSARNTLERFGKAGTLSLMLCFPSQYGYGLITVVRYGERVWMKNAQVTFDTSERPHMYTIEWTPTSVTWRADGYIIQHVSSSEFRIPDEPLKVHIALLLQRMIGKTETLFENLNPDDIPLGIKRKLILEVYQVGFKAHMPITHTELNVVHKESSSSLMAGHEKYAIIGMLFIVILAGALIYQYRCSKNYGGANVPDGYEILLDAYLVPTME